MAINKRAKVNDWQSLQLEKQRMKAVCEMKEQKLASRFSELKSNYPDIAVRALLPFQSKTQQKISGGLDFVNNNLLGLFLPGGRTGAALPKNLVKIAQMLAINLSYNFFRNLLGKRKRKQG